MSIGCSSPDEKANKLFVEASQLVESAKIEEKTSYSNAYKLYEKAQEKLETITRKYPSSNIAVGLVQGNIKIGGYTNTEFINYVVVKAKLKADAEENPLECAKFLVSTLDDKDDDMPALLLNIAVIEANFDVENALKIVSEVQILLQENTYERTFYLELYKTLVYLNARYNKQAIQTAEGIKDPFEKGMAFAAIAHFYSKDGRKEKAVEVLNRALNQFKKVNTEKNSYKNIGLAYIAQIEAEIGQYQEAINLANTFQSSFDKANTLALIAKSYANTAQKEQALEITYQVLLINKNFNVDDKILSMLLNLAIADIYIILGKDNEANQLLTLTYSLNNSDDVSWIIKCIIEVEIASIYLRANEKEKSYDLISQMIQNAINEEYEYSKQVFAFIILRYWYSVSTLVMGFPLDVTIKSNIDDREKQLLREIVRSLDSGMKDHE